MLRTLIEKELKTVLQSPKFVWTFLIGAILILLSIFVGIREYQAAMRHYESVEQLAEQELREQASFMTLNTRTFRKPDPMQIFVSGVQHDIGRVSEISPVQQVKLTNSLYSDDPIFAVFRFIDLTFIVQVVLSLLAILFTYDAINGERERGTLTLLFSNSISRSHYIVAKCLGSWLGLMLPLAVPVMLGLWLILLFGVPLTGEHWLKIAIFLFVSCLYITFFLVLGLLVSARTSRSAVSFLLLLVIWITSVIIIPRVGIMASAQIVPVPSVAEIDAQQDGFAKAAWKNHLDLMEARWQERNQATSHMSSEERAAYRDEQMWGWMQKDDAARREVQQTIEEFSTKLLETWRNRKKARERLALLFTRISPASTYQLAAVTLAETDIHLKTRYENAMRDYRTRFAAYREKKMQEAGTSGGLRISIDSETGMQLDVGGRERGSLNLSDMPKFTQPETPLPVIINSILIDSAILLLFTLIAFSGAFVSFLKYDLR